MGKTLGAITGANAANRRLQSASQGAANAQQAQATHEFARTERNRQEFLDFTRQTGSQNVASAQNFAVQILQAAENPQELQALDTNLGFAERNVQRSEDLIRNIDPTILAASQQALDLLQGKDAAITQSVTRQRQRDRQKLVDRLRGQLGPGFENSSAGIKALNEFDQSTNDLVAQQQQSFLGTLAQTGGAFTQQRGSLFGSAQAGIQGVAGGFGQRQARLLGANINAANLVTGAEQNRFAGISRAFQSGNAAVQQAGQSLVANAGAPFVGSIMRGQADLAQVQQFGQLAGTIGGAMIAGPAGAAAGGQLGGALSGGASPTATLGPGGTQFQNLGAGTQGPSLFRQAG